MWRTSLILLHLSLLSVVLASKWPYKRYQGFPKHGEAWRPNKTLPEFHKHPRNLFGRWLRHLVDIDSTGQLKQVFTNGSIPRGLGSFDNLLDHIDAPTPPSKTPSPFLPPSVPLSPQIEAAQLFKHLPYPIDPRCTNDRSKFWYRTYDGSCNWMKVGEISEGQVGTKKSRDYNQYSYADGISAPREGPNPRAVSNAFFKRKKALFYEHTPLMLGLIEFIIHDVSYSQDSTTEFIDVPVPDDEDVYSRNTTFRVWRTEAVPGTGTSKENPRENINMASTWIDASALYGSTLDVAKKLRTFSSGKLLTQELQTRGRKIKASYLPFNTMDVPTRTRPGIDPSKLFAGGDPRTNEDWVALGFHTILLREHNRLCDILAKQHPEYDDERLYQTIRLVMSAKFALIANSYQMAYWTDKMPWPRDDGFPLYREMSGEDVLGINPANSYPWPLVTKGGKPMVVSTEMAVVYRFHEFIISSFPIKDALNETIWEQDLFGTGFNATGFIEAGLENVIRGMAATHIPNFKSGVDEAFRSAGKYRGRPFDIVTWSIVHEREQGLPTFNTYFRAYSKQDPTVEVPIRNRFEDFSSDPEAVANLKRLYKTPDDVDLVVGVQLDEEIFPGTTIPKTAAIISLFSLFGMGNSDRFSVGFAIMRCLLVDKPWDCHPSNALEELLWAPKPKDGFPNFRFFDQFWLTELDFQAHGTNLLWRLITENTDIKCLQRSPLFPFDPITNPILCSLPSQKVDIGVIALTAVEVVLALVKQNKWKIVTLVGALVLAIVVYYKGKKSKEPPVLCGWPIIGKALAFQKDPKKILLEGFRKYGDSPSKSFGIKLANLTHFVLSQRADLEAMMKDNTYEVTFNLHEFLRVINFSIISRKENFDSDLYTKLIRNNFGDQKTVAAFAKTIEAASKEFLQKNPLAPANGTSQHHNGLNDYFDRYITYVISRCIVGPDSFDNEELLQAFMKFNDDATQAMGLASLLPSFLQFIAARNINKDFKTIRKILIPVIQRRRASPGKKDLIFFLDFILSAVPSDTRAADLVAVVVYAGLTNLQSTFSSTLLDILNTPTLQSTLTPTLRTATSSNINVFSPTPSPWSPLRAAMFESIRLCGPITGPARIISTATTLTTEPKFQLPKGQAATLSSYYTHRDPDMWGADAGSYKYDRFAKQDPPIGEPEYIAWGLRGPHTCPGRWFAMTTIQIMVKEVLPAYEFTQDAVVGEEERYIYSGGNVKRKEVGVEVSRKV